MILGYCVLLTQHDKQLAKTVENVLELDIGDGIHLLKRTILKKYSIFYSEIENKNVTIIKWVNTTFISKWSYFDFSSLVRIFPNLTVLTVINCFTGIGIVTTHVSQAFPF